MPNRFDELLGAVNEAFNDKELIGNLYKIADKEAEEKIRTYAAYKDKAMLGEKSAKIYIVQEYSRIMRYLGIKNLEDMKDLVDFNNIQDNEAAIIFEMLLSVYDISELMGKYDIKEVFDEELLREIAAAEETEIKAEFASFTRQINFLSAIMYSKEYGQDCIDTLQYQNINEIGILNKDYVYIICKGVKIHLEFLKFHSATNILNIQKKTSGNSPYNYDEKNPTVIASKNNSSRISIAGYDITPTDEDLYYNERIFNLEKITLEEMRDRYLTIDQNIYDFLVLNQRGRGSYFVTGSDMGVGKSTFMLAMIEKVPNKWGIGILDTQNELQAHKKYPPKNILTLIENEKRSIAECFEFMLKTSRDVLHVGEVTKPAEVAELINASLRLNAGVGATFHSLGPEEVIPNIRNLLMRTEMYSNAETAETDIARGLDLIINLKKLRDGRIVVNSIDEIVYLEQNKLVGPVLKGSREEKADNLLDFMQQALAKYLYSKSYYLNTLFEYEAGRDKWKIINPPSEAYMKKVSQYLEEDEIQDIKDIFAPVPRLLMKGGGQESSAAF